MAFTPHTDNEIKQMLAAIGIQDIDELFADIPAHLRAKTIDEIPEGRNEASVARLMRSVAALDANQLNFIGAGAYEHHIPAAVWELASRGEFLTAYTPYQAEASQGSLQLIYEYQSMMASLMGLDVSNASLYDGATSLAEAILMAVRLKPKAKARRVVTVGYVPDSYIATCQTMVTQQDIAIEQLVNADLGLDPDMAQIEQALACDAAAIVIPYPSFTGNLQDVNQITDLAKSYGVTVIGLVNPMAMAVLTPPGQWGKTGADIACGEGQPLGIPMSSGGPFFGFLCCTKKLTRQMPGRIVARTTDEDGESGFCLTLQAREQHIRRSKAKSNICTNQGLMVTAATIYMSLLGPEGLKRTALACYHNAHSLAQRLQKIPGVSLASTGNFFHEFVLLLPVDPAVVIEQLSLQNIQPGYRLDSKHLLVCSTEMHTQDDHKQLADALAQVIEDNPC